MDIFATWSISNPESSSRPGAKASLRLRTGDGQDPRRVFPSETAARTYEVVAARQPIQQSAKPPSENAHTDGQRHVPGTAEVEHALTLI